MRPELKDTYGLPLDEIQLLAKDDALSIDLERFKQLEDEAKERSRSTQKSVQQMAGENIFAPFIEQNGECIFVGFNHPTIEATITGLFVDGQAVKEIAEGQNALVILDRTPFYAEKGGQVGDTGSLTSEGISFEVSDTQGPYPGLIAHVGILKTGTLKVGQTLTASIHSDRRHQIENNHTATHLLHWALQKVLGDHIKQAGSVVDPERLRFDFSHHKALGKEELQEIENIVNTKIRENQKVEWYEIPFEEAQKKKEIKQFFGEKYGSKVRVVDINYSKELCGGTHTSTVGSIGYFRIVKEGSIAAGIRRIEAVTGQAAEMFSRQFEEQLNAIAVLIKSPPAGVNDKIQKLIDENKNLQAELKNVRKAQLSQIAAALISEKKLINQIPCIAAQVTINADDFKPFADDLMERLSSGVLVLGLAEEGKCSLLVKVSSDLIQKGIKANELIKAISPTISGSGGGKPDMAQAGGKAPERLTDALAQVDDWLKHFTH